MCGTFISYREEDAKPWALLLRDELAEAFGEEQIYLDKDGLQAGGWHEQLQEALARCKVVLVVIGCRWLSAEDRGGSRRLDDPDDVHRLEISTALARDGMTVIPVLVDGATMPRAEELPNEIRALTLQQARALADRSTHRRLDLAELVEDIEKATGVRALTPGSSGKIRRRWPSRLGAFAVIVVSIYIGMEIDQRHWSWMVFIFVVPALILALLALPYWRDRRARNARSRGLRQE